MKITKNVILDLLPLYLAVEVSADTRALIEEYLESDPELANVAKKLAPIEKPADIPAALTQENGMRAYKKAQKRRFLYTIVIAAVLSFIVLVTMVVFFLTPQ
jgi:predicted anti-sigma-YlaC factor YlaD